MEFPFLNCVTMLDRSKFKVSKAKLEICSVIVGLYYGLDVGFATHL